MDDLAVEVHQERFARTCLNDQEATTTKHIHILSTRNRPAPVISGDSAWGHDHKLPHRRDKRFIKIRVKGLDPPFPPQLFQEIVPGEHAHKIPHRRDKRFVKIRVKGLDPPCPHRFLQSCFSLFAFSFADPVPVLTYSNIISKRGRN